ncbi:MAG: gamma-glutamyltransferase family protein [Gammaproteobacteria bacterium]|nr:gamma-glutamyltransferase family protein [Gammaproteobacteria bacterium]MDH3751994.1 gamma-glutamyltransferase family protein [Gammaproteobacteria bacterium]MDH3806692.1 gamma-glutamyltransferase family protein [Gammaproteobacteria bacterium]
MTKVAVATTSQLAADAAREIAAAGGNAVDCALTAALFTMNAEPSVCALAGSAFITVWGPDHDPVTIDGNVAIPGRGLDNKDNAERGNGVSSVTLDYGSGVTTLAGPGSVAVPGSLAAVERAWQLFGKARWQDLFAPVIAATRDGFPLSAACHYYLGYSGEAIYSRSDDGFFALHHSDRTQRDIGSRIIVPHLADTLSAIADEGARLFYEGELAKTMTSHVLDGGGSLTMQDLKDFEAIERPSLTVDVGKWTIASTPPPAVGGTVLAAMLLACADLPNNEWTTDALSQLINVQRAALDYRKRHLDLTDDVGAEAAKLLESSRSGQLLSEWTSASTVHTSAVDGNGIACAVTASSGYGSGEMPAATGLWLNNCLGELELNRRGLAASPPGARLPSNMAPSIARRKGRVLAAGSPGADRITTALHQFFVNILQMEMPLEQAIAHPRLHVDTIGEAERLMAEPGLDLPAVDMPVSVSPELNMYFGGVGATLVDRKNGFQVASDPRREGGTMICDT